VFSASKKFLPHLVIFAVIAGAYLSGLLTSLQGAVTDIAFRLLSRDASQKIVVVEIDALSLKRLNTWPWPRRYHAILLDRLFAAGARDVALDIDFSSRSNDDDDRALASAMARASGRVVLPVFKQVFRQKGQEPQLIHSSPYQPFAEHARIGTVNIRLEEDGRVRRYLTADDWKDRTVKSMAAVLATDAPMGRGAFYVDYSIDPDTIPRLSYADVLEGNFLNDTVAGRTVIVGATAVELGDQLSVPVFRVLPGPVVQAMAFESLVQGRTLYRVEALPILAVAFLLAVLLGPLYDRWSWRTGLVVTTGVTAGGGLVTLVSLSAWPVFVDTVPWGLVTLLSYLRSLWRAIDEQALSLFQHRVDSMQRRAMMRSVVDDSFDGIVIVNQAGLIELFNPTAEKILGVDADSAAGAPIRDIIPWSQRLEKLISPEREEQEDAGREIFGPAEFQLRKDEADECTLELVVSSSRLSVAGQAGVRKGLRKRVYIFTFRDITERKKTEETQRAAREQAEAASRAKTEFLANMSHELRTPLNAIIGFSEIMRTQAFGPLGNARYLEYTNDIHNSGNHLIEIINDILDMSKIEAGELKPSESVFSFSRIAEGSLRLVIDRARKGEVTVTSEIPADLPRLHADERMIKQILLNLLSNAVKFTPQGGKVTLRARAAVTGLAISVQDTGIGIPEDKMGIILEPFGQADMSLQRQYEGTGLGLPLVKSMTELHGGALEIRSVVGQGTTATVTLPAHRLVRERKIA